MVVALILLGGTRESRAQSTDAKAWAGVTGKIDLLRPLRLDIEHQERLSSSLGVEKSLTEFGLRLRVNSFIRVGAAYRTIATYDDGFWHRGSAYVGAAHDIARFELSYRLLLQTTSRSTETVNDVRNKVGLEYKLSKDIRPSAAFELHYSATNSEFREARFVVGADKKLSKRMSIGAFYMFQSEFNKRVGENNHIAKLGLTYVFRKIKAPKPTVAEDSEDAEVALSGDPL